VSRQQPFLHPTCTISRTTLDYMALILLSLIGTVTMTVVAISMMRYRFSSGALIRSGLAKTESFITGKSAERSATPSPLKPFLVVVLPDGTIVTPSVAGQV
jgi:hypothetical protein